MALSGELFTRDEQGHPMRDVAFLIALNRDDSAVELTLPLTPYGSGYHRLLDTSLQRPDDDGTTHPAGTTTTVGPQSVTVLRVEPDRTGWPDGVSDRRGTR
jgi:hypothetical protein